MATEKKKPAYKIPLVKSILKHAGENGRVAVSTFSGCGGACLGMKWAGFKVAWANEFVKIAADTYELNHPGSLLDRRDIRKVQAQEILTAIGLKKGELDYLEGSPPCDSFSMSGKRYKRWGTEKEYYGEKQRTDDLFLEFVRLIKGLKPKVFTAENVKGLVIGRAVGYFKEILHLMEKAGYHVDAKILNGQWLGVPQARQRVFYCGVRKDLGVKPRFPTPLPYYYSMADACDSFRATVLGEPARVRDPAEDDPKIWFKPTSTTGRNWAKVRIGHQSKENFNFVKPNPLRPSPTILAAATANYSHPFEPRCLTIREFLLLSGFPPDFQLIGARSKQVERIGLAVPPQMSRAMAQTVCEILEEAEASNTVMDQREALG